MWRPKGYLKFNMNKTELLIALSIISVFHLCKWYCYSQPLNLGFLFDFTIIYLFLISLGQLTIYPHHHS